MKGVIKGIVIGIVIIIIGVAVLLIGLALNGWTLGDDIETDEFVTENIDIDLLKIELNAGTLETRYHDENYISIKYPCSDKFSATVTEDGNTLSVISHKYNFWDFPFFNFKIPHTVITLPRSMRPEVDLKLNAGSANFDEGEFTKFRVEVNAGSVNFESIDCAELSFKVNAGSLNAENVIGDNIYCKVNAGSLNVELSGKMSDYSISVEKNAGSCNLSSQSGDTEKRIEVKVNAGSADFSFSD